MNKINFLLVYTLSIFFIACKGDKSDKNTEEASKLESIKVFAQAQPGGEHFEFDMPIDKGLDHLEVTEQQEVDIDSEELVLGVSFDNNHYAIPIRYLAGFEVANLRLNKDNYLLTWCPLVGSARIFEGELKGDNSGFDFGRGLIENNLLIVDRKTNSVWNQLSCKSVKGELEGERLAPMVSLQSTWEFWKNKYPDTHVIFNQDTSEAVFPESVFNKPYYNTWIPGEKYPGNDGLHHTKNLGLGLELGDTAAFFPFEELFQKDSPISYTLNSEKLEIHFDKAGLTAWVTDSNGNMIASTLVYNWAWSKFFPTSEIYKI
ncbi:MAG: DUF3179 domain-containing (seleno)protein [Bacteroidota bacterium]